MTHPYRPPTKRLILATVILAASMSLIVFFTLALTSQDIGWTWDETYYFMSSELQIAWFKALWESLSAGDFSFVVSQKVIDQYWLWDLSHNPHPPLYRILSGASWVLFKDLLGDLIAYRLATALQASVLILFIFIVLQKRYGNLPALYGSLALFLSPVFFGHAHLAATEIPVATCWLLVYWAFWKGLDHARGSLLAGIFLGCALATKFTAVLIPFPFLIWALVYREKKALRNIACAAFLAPLIAIAVNPGWWHQPLDKIVQFISISLARKETIPITTFFLGKTYHFSPPWYYCTFMLAVTTPVTFLGTTLLGIAYFLKQHLRSRYDNLFLLNIPWICGVVMLPNAPVHDGIRQFFAVLPFLAYAAGAGFWYLGELLNAVPLKGIAQRSLQTVCLLILVLYPASQVMRYHPYGLSYYNELMGGLSGARARGMEVTYWYDVVSQPVLDAISTHIPTGARINSWPNAGYFGFLQERGLLGSDYIFVKPDIQIKVKRHGLAIEFSEKPDYLILLSRLGYFNMLYRAIQSACPPVYSLTFEDVPLIAIYRWQDVIRELSHCDIQRLVQP